MVAGFVALASCLRHRTFRPSWVAASGAILVGWIVGEVVILPTPQAGWIEGFYIGLGLLMFFGGPRVPRRT